MEWQPGECPPIGIRALSEPFRVAQFGTFEVDNYGDLLFPLVLRQALRRRLGEVEVELFSPTPGSFRGDPSMNVRAIGEKQLDGVADRFDAYVIGGGDLVSFSRLSAPEHGYNLPRTSSAHAACWALPALCRHPDVPILWNAPGVPHPFRPEQAVVLWDLCTEVDYRCVRDEPSRRHLREAGVEGEIEVVPDTALCLPELLSPERARQLAAQRLAPLGLAPGGYLAFQIAPWLLKQLGVEVREVARFLGRLARQRGESALLLPVGYCHGDRRALERIRAAAPSELPLLAEPLPPLELAAVIASASAFVGSSFHGNVTAFAYGLPHLMVNSGALAKLEGFAEHVGRPESLACSWDELLGAASRLGQGPDQASRRAALRQRIEVHFDRLAEGVRSGREASRHAGSSAEQQLNALRRRLFAAESVFFGERLEHVRQQLLMRRLERKLRLRSR
jgi:polysaccharide pyruvyl transferase WcaK-like protein